MQFWRIFGDLCTIFGVLGSIIAIFAFFRPRPDPNKKKLLLIAIPFALVLVFVGLFSIVYSSLPAGTALSANIPVSTATSIPTLSHTPTNTPTPSQVSTPTTVPSSTPISTPTQHNTGSSQHPLAQFYQGKITDENALDTTSDMFLCTVTQNGNTMAGSVKLTLFSGSGPFTGSISNSNSVHFTIANASDGYGPSDFTGTLNPDGSMSGTYINESVNHHGDWQVRPTNQQIETDC